MAMILSRRPAKAGSARKSGELRPEDQEIEFLRREIIVFERARQPGDMLDEFVAFVRPKLRPDLAFCEFFDVSALRADNEIVDAHRLDFLAQPVGDIAAQLPMLRLDVDRGARLAGVRDRRRDLVIVARVSLRLDRLELLVDLDDQLHALGEEALAQRVARRAIGESRGSD